MQLREQLGVFEVLVIVVHEHLASLLVERTFGEGHDEQALDDLQDVGDRPLLGVPVLLESVHTDLALFGYVGVEYFGDEIA